MEQYKKNKILLFSLVFISVLTAGFYWFTTSPGTERVDPTLFQVPELARVDKVVLQSPGDTLRLELSDGRWKVNQEYKADRNMIDVLFATLQQAVPKRSVGASLTDSVRSHLRREGVTVSLFVGSEEVANFVAGGNPSKTLSFFWDPQRQDIFVMMIPGYRVYVSGIFELEETGWWEKRVFDFNWRNFVSLQVNFPSKPEESFSVTRRGNEFLVDGMLPDTARLNTFLDDLSLLQVSRFQKSERIADSLETQEPFAGFIVTDVASRKYTLKIFKPEANGPVQGFVDENQPALFERREIEYLLRPKAYFRKK